MLDLDNVLWGGVVGEVGWTGINLGGHDHVGEAFADFQRALKALAARGVQLALVSRNDEATALEAIDRHPEMQLRREDFAGWRINWEDKAQNIAGLLAELNLGDESAVFIDDSAIERERVRTAIPEVLVPEWPDDPARFREALGSLRCFDSPFLTEEDRRRTAMSAAERSRRCRVSTAVASVEDWLQSLDISVTVEMLSDGNLDRAVQLFNKTNQMNLATRRLSKPELASLGGGARTLPPDVPRLGPLRRFGPDGNRRTASGGIGGPSRGFSAELSRHGTSRRGNAAPCGRRAVPRTRGVDTAGGAQTHRSQQALPGFLPAIRLARGRRERVHLGRVTAVPAPAVRHGLRPRWRPYCARSVARWL